MGIFWEKKNKEDGKKSRFLHEINEIPNEGGCTMSCQVYSSNINFN